MEVRFSIEKLRADHPIEKFDCGQDDLNRFLARYALAGQLANASQTYVGLYYQTAVVGFYTLVFGQVAFEDAPPRIVKGLGRYPVPIMLLARLAVGTGWQREGLGAGLLKDALRRTMQAADIAGIRAFVAHAKDERAQSFYAHFNFIPSPTDPLHMFLLLKDLKKILPET